MIKIATTIITALAVFFTASTFAQTPVANPAGTVVGILPAGVPPANVCSPAGGDYIAEGTGKTFQYTNASWPAYSSPCNLFGYPTTITGVINGSTNNPCGVDPLSNLTYNGGLSNPATGLAVYTGVTPYRYWNGGSYTTASLNVRMTINFYQGGTAIPIAATLFGSGIYIPVTANFDTHVLIETQSPAGGAVYCSGLAPSTYYPSIMLFDYLQTDPAYQICTSFTNGSFYTTTVTASASNNGPVSIGGSATLSSTGTGNGTLTYAWTGPNSYGTQNHTINPTAAPDYGLYTITVTDVFGCPNTSTTTLALGCTPSSITPDLGSIPDATGQCSVTPVTPTATNNCGTVVNGTTPTIFPVTAQGTTVITWTYTDGTNTTTQNQNVVINDITNPVAICQNISVNLDGSNNATITGAMVNNASTDNCGIASLSVSPSTFNCSNLGANAVTLTVTDVNGNTNTCAATVTVNAQEIDVQGFGISIVDGDVTPIFGDATKLPDVLVCSGTSSSTFTIFNTGTSNLTFLTPTFVGGAAGDFSLTTAPVSPVLPGGSTTFTVTCNPSLIGNQNTTLTFTNNDCDENPYNFLIRCVGLPDVILPTLTAGADITTTTSADGTGNCTVAVAVPDAVFNDNCPIILNWSMTGAETASGTGQIGTYTFPVGTTTITYSVTDFGLNTATDVLVVTVTDNEAPVVTAAVDIVTTTSADGLGNCTVSLAIANATLVENCSATLTWAMTGAETLSGSGQVGTHVFSIGITTITYTYTDGAGLTSTDAMTVTVTDNELPLITFCPLDIITTNDSGICGAIATFAAIASDNCGAVITYSQASGTVFPVGNTIVVVTATDAAGQTDVCSFFVDVTDTEAPVALCQNVTVNLNAAGVGSTTAAAVNNVSTDNCGIASLSLSQTAFNCSSIATNPNPVTLTVTDIHGVVSTCPATVTVIDGVAPVAVCQNVTVNLDASGTGSTTAALVNNGSTDACGIASLVLNQTGFTCADVAVSPVITLTVTDVNSNTNTCTSTVTVVDPIAPTAICQNISVNLNAAGSVTVSSSQIDNLSSDACGIALLQINGSANQIYTCANVGANTATLTVIDNNSNVSTCTATVTVNDITLPIAVCQNITVPLNPSGNASVTVAMINNGSSDACGLAGLSVSPNNFTCANLGPNPVTLFVLDNNGNSSSCVSTVTIIDIIPPVANCQNITVSLNAGGTATATAAMVNNLSTDNCSIASLALSNTAFTCANVGGNPVTLTVTDGSGNVSTCPATVTVQDIILPTAICQNLTVNLNAGGTVTVNNTQIDNGSFDNCGIGALQINGGASQVYTCANLGVNNATLTVVDDNSNVSTCVSTITVIDIIAPVAVCAPITVVLNASGNATITAAMIDGGSTDNCSISTMTASQTAFTCANVGPNNVTLTVTDASGNSSTCVAVVTVQDNSIPVVTCPGNITQNAVINNCGKIVNYTIGVVDNCATVTQTDLSGLTSGSLFPVGVTTQSYTITDAGGNTSTCSFTVTILDIQNPVITGCPANIVVSTDLNQCNANVFWTAPVASDNCSGVVLTSTFAPGSNFPLGTTPVTYTATDASGHTATCSFTVTVNDTQFPTIVCPAAIALNADPGLCNTTIASIGSPVTADNCSVASVTNNHPSSIYLVGATTVVWTVVDGAGNTTTCNQLITITDNQAPNALCQNATVNLNAAGNGSTTAAAVNNGSTDNCGIGSLTLSQTTFTCANVGSNSVTLTVLDVNGNSSTCPATVTVIDAIAPVAICQNVTVNLDAVGNGSTTAALVNNASTDACGIASLSLSQSAFTCANVGSNPVTLTVTDVNGNSSTCSSTVTVVDPIAPIAMCQPFTAQLDASGNVTIVVANIDNGSSDACGIASMSVSPNTFNCSNIGSNAVTLTVTDVNGNISTCNTTVTVEDNVAPAIICQNITVNLDASGNASIIPADVTSSASDACGIASSTIDVSSFTCSKVGPNTVTLTVTDVNGNVSTCTAIVTVVDAIAPNAICQPQTISLDASGNASITAAMIDNGSNDACGIATVTVTPMNFTCSNVGANTVTLTVTDVNGNVSTCTSIVTVQDNTLPVIVCQDIIVQLNGLGNATITASDVTAAASDNCSIASSTIDISSFNCANIGPNTVTLTVTDVNGNVSTCTSIVTVQDNVAPAITCQNITVNLDAAGNASIIPADVTNTATDACGIASSTIDISSFTCANVGNNNVVLTVTDVNGNSSNCTAIVTVVDAIAPTALCQPQTINLDNLGNATITTAMIDNGSFDNCSIATLSLSQSNFSCSDIGANVVTLTVTDVNGNSSSCFNTVTVVDIVIPTIVCQDITVQLDATGNVAIVPTDVTLSAFDACGIVSSTIDVSSFNCGNVGPNTVSLTVTDVNGNVATCTSTVTVQDNVAPVITCQDIIVNLDASGNASIIPADVTGSVSDACGIATSTIDVSSFTCSNVGPNTVTLTVTDVNGNVSTCTSTVTVNDVTPPTAVCQNITVPLNGMGSVTITGADVNNGSNDACGIASLSVSPSFFTCANEGPNAVTLTVTDVNGNVSTCSATVTITDNIAPVITCPMDVLVSNDPGLCTASSVAIGNATAVDNCSLIIAISNNAPAVFPLGNTNVTWTATDLSGNTSTCVQIVTVHDVEDPIISCPSNVTISADLGSCVATAVVLTTATATDNCTIVTITNDAPATFPLGITNVTWTATDLQGNIATCTQFVTVVDTESPSIICPANIATVASLGACTANGLSLGTPTTADNCTVASVTNNAPAVFPLGTTTVTWTVTDAAGNTNSCTQTVTVSDNQAPTIICPTDVTVSADLSSCVASGVVLGTPTTADNCSIASITNDAPAAFPLGNTTVTWTIIDGTGNIATCTQLVSVLDTELPTIVCPAAITYSADAGLCTATVVLASPATADNCSGAIVTNNAPVAFPLGNTTVTWTITDGSGNTATCTQLVTVVDTQVPTILCPANVTVSAGGGSCVAVGVALGTPTTADNCSVASVTNNAPATYSLGTTTVTWTVTDGSGLTATCNQTVTVIDTELPTITCPVAVTVPANAGTCVATGVVLGAPVASDNCTFVVTNNAPASFNLGNTTVTWTVTDGSGNTATCTQLVTVVDTQVPTIVCPVAITIPADAGVCTATVVLAMPATADNCSIASVTNNAPATFPLGNTTVTWTVIDGSGNTATCTQLVTVTDTQVPTILCPANVTVSAGGGSCVAVGVALGTPTTADNCSVASVTNNAPATYNIGSTIVTWTVTDGSGLTATCTQTVTVIDTELPIITCPVAVTVPANTGTCVATGVVLGTPVASDNCTFVVTNNAPATFNLGTTTVTWTVTDVSGNTATCTQLVTVLDTQLPTITCPVAVTVPANLGACVATGVVLGTPVTADNCSIASVTNNAPATFNLGTTTVTWTIVDGSGNTATCTQLVTVVDNQFPTITCPANVMIPANLGTCVATGVVLGTPTTADNCSVASVTNNGPATYNLGTTIVTWSVVDGSGNVSTCNQTVTVIDTQFPTITCPVAVTVPANLGSCVATGVVLGTPTTADNCSVASVTNNAPVSFNLGNTTVTWSVVDGSGNTTTCTQIVTVVDTQFPTITCPVAVTVPANAGACVATGVALGAPVVGDNCSIASVTNNAPATFNLGTTTVTWTIVDGSGNTTSCNQTVTVIDTQMPTITCPVAVTVPANAGSCVATGVVLGTPTTADNCSVASVVNNAPATFPLGVTTVIWSVTDGSGNTSVCTQFVTVIDTQVPTITCPVAVTVPANAGVCTAAGVLLGAPTTADNCSVASVTNNAPAVYPLGNTTVTWTVTDGSGNTATCTQIVTVIDTQVPTITCPVAVTVPANVGSCVATGVVLGTPVTADNCSVASVTNNAPATFPLGTTNVVWTVVDGSGLTATCTQTVTVVDTQAPVIACPANVTVSAGGGSCVASGVALGTPATSDNCSVASVTNNAPATFPLGTTNVIWTVVDGSGNTVSCTQTVTVTDNQNPTIACPFPVTIAANLGSCAATGVVLATPATADNCSVASVTNNAPASFPLGTTNVTWTVTDGSGNTATCVQPVTIIDTQNPTIVCPAPVSVASNFGTCVATGVVLGTPATADNCSVASVTNNAPAIYPLGNTTVTWTVTDGSGHTATCTQIVTVVDAQLPTITCPVAVTVPANIGSCVATGVVLGTPTTADNCSVASVTNNAPGAFPLGNTTVIWTVTDGSGNTATCNQIVTVLDTQNPTIICSASMTVNSDPGMCTSTFTLTAPSVSDNCSVASVTGNAPAAFPLGTTTVTWVVVDGSGNTSTCSQTVTVIDNELPTIACPADIALNNMPGFCGRSVNYTLPAIADNCSIASFTQTDNSGYIAGDLFPIGTTYQEFTVVDGSGNTVTCGFNITITDTELPQLLNCPGDMNAMTTQANECGVIVNWQNPATSDNCPGVVLNQTHYPGETFPIGMTVVTYTAIDNAGNTSTCSFTVTVTDMVNPTISVSTDGSRLIAANSTADSYQWVDCDNGYAPVPNATGSVFSPSVAGNYAVIIKVGGCVDTSNCQSAVPAPNGIEEVVFEDVVLYPNPSFNGSFKISYAGELQSVMVYDMMGREVFAEVDLINKSVDGSQLASGKYMIRILTENRLINKEFVVVKGEK